MSSCPCWIPAATSLGTVVPYALLLLAFYIMLSRKIAQLSCGMQVRTSPGEHPSPHPTPAPAPAPGGDTAQKPGAQKPGAQKPGAQNPPAAYAGSSDTSSETSEDSDSPSSPQGPGSGENIHYTSLVFPGHEPGSAQDYENIKTGMDYVNVDPKRKKINFWPFSSPRASKGVEYTEVKL